MSLKNVGAEMPFRRDHQYTEDGKRRTGSAVLDHEREEFAGEARDEKLSRHSGEYRDMARKPD